MCLVDEITIERREPVWKALSEFYLDTELQPVDFCRIRAVFIKSSYSFHEIRQINYDEVAPLLLDNLLNVAGVWSEFDEHWLTKTISMRLEKQATWKSSSLFKWLWHKRVDYFTKTYFQQVFK